MTIFYIKSLGARVLLFVLLSYFCGIMFELYDYISGISTYLIYTKPEKGGKLLSLKEINHIHL